jgi:hypothetical protein
VASGPGNAELGAGTGRTALEWDTVSRIVCMAALMHSESTTPLNLSQSSAISQPFGVPVAMATASLITAGEAFFALVDSLATFNDLAKFPKLSVTNWSF